ncbi:MAG: pseudaminic acid cytidylyltransferase [Pseudomonadota bacterium]
MKNTAIIPARGGSKRIPRKNIMPFLGKPMIGWSIEAAIDSGLFDRIIVSTDDPEIAETAKNFGAQVPFMRPPHLSDDHTPTVPVIAHALHWLSENQGETEAGLVCCLYATAPFIEAQDLVSARALLIESDADYALPVTSFAFPIERAVDLSADNWLTMRNPENSQTRSQDLREAYHDAGQFYWGRQSAWAEQRPVLGGDAVGLPIPRTRVQDIDTPEDWARAEALMRALQSQTGV